MICPYCDSLLKETPESGTCPNCGGSLRVDENNPMTLEDYYYRYKPNRVRAIKALRRDTGMGLVEAKKAIDGVFDELSRESHRDLRVSAKIIKNIFK